MRDLEKTYPSPSEADTFCMCPTAWVFRYPLRIRKKESATRLLSGEAVSNALDQFYKPSGPLTPLEVYDSKIAKAREENPAIPEEEWQSQIWQDRSVLSLYLKMKARVEDDWQNVIGVQIKLKHPAWGIPDLAVRSKAGHITAVEFKVISGFADVEYENLKYEMAFQPIFYTVGLSEYFEEAVNEVEIRYLIRPKAASGRYKEAPATIEAHKFTVEEWKKEMWLYSAEYFNSEMIFLQNQLMDGEMPLSHIPKFTRNCIKVLGHKTYPCDYYLACSVNMHPLQVVGVYEEVASRKETT